MKSVVTDRAALESMMPGTVEAYLRANGWQEVNRTEGLASVWCSPDNKSRRGFDLLVPLEPELGDYAERMADLFLKLESFEQRSADSIYQAFQDYDIQQKGTQRRPEFVLQGRVIQLRKTEDMPEGSVIVHGRVDTQEREVAMSLTPAHYRLAVEAHGAGLGVRCEGELLVRGGTYKLLGVTRFTVPQRGP